MRFRKPYRENFIDNNKIRIERNNESKIWVVCQTKTKAARTKEINT